MRRALAWGATWAFAVAVTEALAMGPARWSSPLLLLWWLMYWVIPLWCLIGSLLLWVLDDGVHLAAPRRLIVGSLALASLPVLVQPPLAAAMMNLSGLIFPRLHEFAADVGVVPLRESWLAIGIYNLWLYLFYGGLLAVAYLLTRRRERSHALLHASAMSRSRTEALLDAERLQALQAQIDPSLLLDSMRELEQLYRSDPQHAERLLEALVEFLRHATQSLRASESTLDRELRLAHAFAHLQRIRGIAGAWKIEEEPAGFRASSRFPSLLILPLLSLGGTQSRPLLRTKSDQSGTLLQLLGLAHEISTELRQQMHARLQALYGTNFTFDYSDTLPTQLAITLNSDVPKGVGDNGR